MFELIKKIFIVLLSDIVNGSNHTKYFTTIYLLLNSIDVLDVVIP